MTLSIIVALHFQHKLCMYMQDIDFFQHLEMHMHSELPSLVGRDHLSFRSFYLPVKVCNILVLHWKCKRIVQLECY